MVMYFKPVRSSVPAKDGKKKWHLSLVKDKQIVNTQQLGDMIAEKSSLTPGDVHNVIRNLMSTMRQQLLESRSVRLDGLGTFTLIASCKGNGVDTPEEVGPQQIRYMRCRFTPEYTRTTFTGTTRHLYDGIRFEHVNNLLSGSIVVSDDEGDNGGDGDDGLLA
ncbi:MAG: HU family DNA-binding protein [Bacteroides sp.]|nr:HU family DNA-binding protein [Bacteroides sp.]